MTGLWSLLLPEEATNLVTNPSGEEAATGYTAVGGSLARTSEKSRRGAYSIKITPTAGTGDGCYYGTVSLINNTVYTFSVDVWAAASIPITIYFATTGGTLKGTATDLTGNGDWQRTEVTWTADATASFRLYVIKDNSASTASFYIDGLQCEAKSYSTSYCDGDQPGCEWTRALHASTSRRDSQSRNGGREYNLDAYAFYISESPGIGMPERKHLTQERAMLPGAYYKSSKVQARTFDLVGDEIGTSRTNLHYQRQQFLDAIKPDRVRGDQPVTIKYSGANTSKPVSIQAIHDTGLAFGALDGFSERVQARFIAWEDPFFYEEGDRAHHLTYTQEITNADCIVAKIDNSWQIPSGTGANGVIRAFAEDSDGNIIAVGSFTSIGGVAANYIAKFDGDVWTAYGSGLSGVCHCVAVAPNGDIYAGGDTYAKKWNGSSWSDLGTGPNNIIYAVAIDFSGNVYWGGLFTTFNGVTVNYICLWNGTTAVALASGMGARVTALAIGKDAKIYIGGYFTTDGEANSMPYAAVWDGSVLSALGTGLNSTVNAAAVGPNGWVYYAGAFTTAGGVMVNYFTAWNGSTWIALGTGLNDVVYALSVSPITGVVYLTGNFTAAGDLDLTDRTALWNGYTYAHLDVDLPGTSYAQTVHAAQNGDLYFGYSMTGSAYSSYVNAVNNAGTRTAYVKAVFSRSGGTSMTVKWLKNETTGATLYLNYALLDGEKLTIDMRPGERQVISNYYGNTLRAVLRNSDLGQFFLLPGNNNISCLVTVAGSPTAEAYLLWQSVHWSVDGVATG